MRSTRHVDGEVLGDVRDQFGMSWSDHDVVDVDMVVVVARPMYAFYSRAIVDQMQTSRRGHVSRLGSNACRVAFEPVIHIAPSNDGHQPCDPHVDTTEHGVMRDADRIVDVVEHGGGR